MPTLQKTTKREITRRSVLYVGYPCNIRCKFCYYTFAPDKRWRPIEETKHDANLFRKKYGHERVDITGGEPTIYPNIFDLSRHCSEIGLRPSLITNTQVLADEDTAQKFADSGVYDFLCSLHALGDLYNEITQTQNGWGKLEKAVGNLNRLGIPWRVNCTLNRHILSQLEDIAKYAAENGARVINFISFNPFYEWEEKGGADFQARHSEIMPSLTKALEYCDRVNLEANVRYLPFCMMRGHEEKCYNFQQVPYDSHEWNYTTWSFAERGLFDRKTRWIWQGVAGNAMRWLGKTLGEETTSRWWAGRNKRNLYEKGAPCNKCRIEKICDCFTKQYATRYGFDEARPYDGVRITDPVHFISKQEKVID
ncbi:MAG: radical SAM protein [Kiritimatiellae bacterium]|nr:radical SAM protein [Kiritimatiellia bacterium]